MSPDCGAFPPDPDFENPFDSDSESPYVGFDFLALCLDPDFGCLFLGSYFDDLNLFSSARLGHVSLSTIQYEKDRRIRLLESQSITTSVNYYGSKSIVL